MPYGLFLIWTNPEEFTVFNLGKYISLEIVFRSEYRSDKGSSSVKPFFFKYQ